MIILHTDSECYQFNKKSNVCSFVCLLVHWISLVYVVSPDEALTSDMRQVFFFALSSPHATAVELPSHLVILHCI